jgi:hypothetical protein
MRSDLWQAWAVAAAAALFAVFGTPAHWDSFRLVFAVAAGAAAAGAAVAAMPRAWRVRVISAAVVFHFGGILMATTSPPPTPWLTEQLFQRVYNPYLQFVYLRNAYHFYSPEPGPASLLAMLLKTESGVEQLADGTTRKTYEYRWVVLPRRPADVRDPLGLTYYRRLSLTEQVARGVPGLALPADQFEKHEVRQRRLNVAIPLVSLGPGEDPVTQYRVPHPDIMRFVIPSYAQHVIMNNTPDDDEVRRKTTVKIYRIEHRTLDVTAFIGVSNRERQPIDPYHPATYRPYFLGEFDVYGNLVDPQEPMLYWLVPVIPRSGGPAPGDPEKKDYHDFFSEHAGHKFNWRELR